MLNIHPAGTLPYIIIITAAGCTHPHSSFWNGSVDNIVTEAGLMHIFTFILLERFRR